MGLLLRREKLCLEESTGAGKHLESTFWVICSLIQTSS